MDFVQAVELTGKTIDTAGVSITVIGAATSGVVALRDLRAHATNVYRNFRSHLGRSILLGLELLVAADIIRTVAVTPTLNSVLVLGVIVIIRTFLSFSLELEITGRWPWQKPAPPAAGDTDG